MEAPGIEPWRVQSPKWAAALVFRGNGLTGIEITAGTGIEASANAKVVMTGGSIKATANSVVAGGGAKVDCFGATVTGKSKATGGAKITGAN